jgi:hypothetical protein
LIEFSTVRNTYSPVYHIEFLAYFAPIRYADMQ